VATAIEGTITVDGIPARIATVELLNREGDILDQIAVDDHGHFRYHLAPGSWTLNVYDARGNKNKTNITLSEGEDRTLNLELKEGAP
jgi:hypothetical protein